MILELVISVKIISVIFPTYICDHFRADVLPAPWIPSGLNCFSSGTRGANGFRAAQESSSAVWSERVLPWQSGDFTTCPRPSRVPPLHVRLGLAGFQQRPRRAEEASIGFLSNAAGGAARAVSG